MWCNAPEHRDVGDVNPRKLNSGKHGVPRLGCTDVPLSSCLSSISRHIAIILQLVGIRAICTVLIDASVLLYRYSHHSKPSRPFRGFKLPTEACARLSKLMQAFVFTRASFSIQYT